MSSHGPGWWYQSWSLGDWLDTLFDQPVEVQTFGLGLLVGAGIAMVAARSPRGALGLTGTAILILFGVFEPVVPCGETVPACSSVRVKPWYFLAGVFLARSLEAAVSRLYGVIVIPSGVDPDSSRGA